MRAAGVIRRLWPVERDEVRAHLLRLDPEDRRLRFGGQIGDEAVGRYADRLDWHRALLIGRLVDGEVRGLGELKPLSDAWPRTAELAFSVERAWQNRGIGTDLLRRLIVMARNRMIRRLNMICVPENHKVVRIARKLGARPEFQPGEVEARLIVPWPNQVTYLLELIDEARAMVSPPGFPGLDPADSSAAGAAQMPA